MFTGLIEAVGEVTACESRVSGGVIRLRTALAADVVGGDSLAVNGVCLTIHQVGDGEVGADIGPETARLTTLGSISVATRVNLERALRADGRLGGHIVQGHVDGMGTIRDVRAEGDANWLTIGCPEDLAAGLIRKGSIAVDGVSLTVAELRGTEFDLMIVPYTWQHTNLSARKPGDSVNLELDVIGKYVARLAEVAVLGRLRPPLTS